MPIVAPYTFLAVGICKDCSWKAFIAEVVGKGVAHVGKRDVILADSHPDTTLGIKNFLVNVIIPKLE